MSDAALLLTAY